MRLKHRSVLICCLLVIAALLSGCNDPTEELLKKGQNFDFARQGGIVTGKSIMYYLGDQTWTKELMGKPYYCIDMKWVEENGTETTETLVNVPVHIWDEAEIEKPLNDQRYIDWEKLKKMNGSMIDRYIDTVSHERYGVFRLPSGVIKDMPITLDVYHSAVLPLRLPYLGGG